MYSFWSTSDYSTRVTPPKHHERTIGNRVFEREHPVFGLVR